MKNTRQQCFGSLMRSRVFLAAAVVTTVGSLALAPARDALAQGSKAQPMAVVTFSGYDQLIADVNYIGGLIGKDGLSQIVEGYLAAVTGGAGLNGMDKSKPWGLIVQTDGEQSIEPIAIIPVKDLKKLLGAFQRSTGPAQLKNGVYELQVGPQTLFIKEKTGWAFAARSSEALASVPADPLKVLGALAQDYDIAVRLYVQRIPAMFRDMAIDQLKQGAELGLERQDDESDDDYEARRKLVEAQLEQMGSLVNDTETVTVGWNIDSKQSKVYIDFGLTATANSKLAKQTAQFAKAKSNFMGFFDPEAAITANVSTLVGGEEEIEQAVATIETFRTQAMKKIDADEDLPSDEARETVKSALGELFDVATATIKEGKIDAAGMWQLSEDHLQVALGAQVADGKAVEGAIKKLAELGKDQPSLKEVKWDADKHAGVRFHTFSVEVEKEKQQQLFGDTLDIVLGIGEKSVYLAFGDDGIDTLKEAIDGSKSEASKLVPPVQMIFSVGQLLGFASAQNPDDEKLAAAAGAIGDDDGDSLSVTLKGVTNGFQYRVEVEEGLIKAIGAAAAAEGN